MNDVGAALIGVGIAVVCAMPLLAIALSGMISRR